MNKLIKITLAFIVISLFSGCMLSTFIFPIETVKGLENSKKIDMSVSLDLSKELCEKNREIEVPRGSTLVIEGNMLCKNAVKITEATFTDVKINRGERHDDISLSVKFVDMDYAIPLWAGSKVSMTIILEWTLVSENNKLIWTDTIRGNTEVKSGNAFTYEKVTHHHLQITIDDLFMKSFTAMNSSVEIRNFSEQL